MFIISKDDGSYNTDTVFLGIGKDSGLIEILIYFSDKDSKENNLPVHVYQYGKNLKYLESYDVPYYPKWKNVKAKDFCNSVKDIEDRYNVIVNYYRSITKEELISNYLKMRDIFLK